MTDRPTKDRVTMVKGYADLLSHPKLRGDDPDIIARELQQHGHADDWLIAWVESWLVDEKDVEPVGRSDHIVSGRLDYETEKAYLLVDGRDEIWLPKSVIRVFRAQDGADFEIPQQGISDFATEGGEQGV